ncbi:MAG: hypothetical protein ACE5EM_12475 [Sphingomonadales bacterium]
MATQQEIASALQTAANRANQVGARPASSRQVWYLAKLIADAGRDASDIGREITNSRATLTGPQASQYITDYQTNPPAPLRRTKPITDEERALALAWCKARKSGAFDSLVDELEDWETEECREKWCCEQLVILDKMVNHYRTHNV